MRNSKNWPYTLRVGSKRTVWILVLGASPPDLVPEVWDGDGEGVLRWWWEDPG